MNWYNGNISEAVALSKTRNAIFVVFVEGKDETTKNLKCFINETRIREKLETDDFVAIKIESESESYMQFASIYQIVPVPSMFFIGQSGKPLDVATGVLKTVEELEGKIAKVLQLAGKSTSASSVAMTEFIKEESKASTSSGAVAHMDDTKKDETNENNSESNNENICKDGVCIRKTNESLEDDKKMEESPKTNQVSKDEEARKYLEQKRSERIEEEKRLEKEHELRRRKEGKEMQHLRAQQQDKELKELKENIKREKLEEQAARERIRAQIAADKVERAQKFGADTPATLSETAHNSNGIKSNTSATLASDESRLQFRFSNGSNNNHSFKCNTKLMEIRDYVTRELLPGTGIKDFTLATTYPKRELTSKDDNKTITELELFPSAVLLVIGKTASGPIAIISRNGGLLNMLYLMMMSVVNPILSIYASAKNWFTGKRSDGDVRHTGAQKRSSDDYNLQNDVAKRRNLYRFTTTGVGNSTGTSNQDDLPTTSSQSGAYQRYNAGSNIHRLSDHRKDSDDENATWNGNSTQQQ